MHALVVDRLAKLSGASAFSSLARPARELGCYVENATTLLHDKEGSDVSETLKLQKAQREYRKFIQGLSVCRARHTRLFERDPDFEPCVKVAPAEALNCFLRENPSYKPFRKDLGNARGDKDDFLFVKELWNRLLDA